MIKFFRYLRVQLRRTRKLYPAILAFTVLLTAVLAVLVVGLFSQNDSQESKMKMRIGMVGSTEDSYLGIGVAAVQNFDTSKLYLEFVNLDEAAAKQQLKSGDLIGYILVPDGFVDSVAAGENAKLTYVADNNPSAVGPLLTEEIVTIAADLILEAQSGIYSYRDMMYYQSVPWDQRYDNMQVIASEYIRQILARETVYDIEYVGISAGLPFKEYYFCAFFVLLLMLCGTVCAHLLVKTDLSLPRLLYCSGHRLPGLIAAEYLPFALMLCLNTVLLFAGVGFATQQLHFALLPEVNGVLGYALLALRLVPAVLLITMMQFFVYELTSTIISGVLLQVLTTVSLAFASGLLYPLSSLPQVMQQIAAFLPTGVAFSYAADTVYTGRMDTLLTVLLYIAGLFILTMLVRRLKLRGAADE